ncbi:hypothetical protein DdX_08614 [Ditylenchus destructor]|uniref:Uncharacterized protein n=1 Tax=Ditylenchus destructor TaxID=166010 RepID=A0AAD4R7D6_9BILA|nr:hypothetical protein DdX_08614 [Ditylenchus destructor]
MKNSLQISLVFLLVTTVDAFYTTEFYLPSSFQRFMPSNLHSDKDTTHPQLSPKIQFGLPLYAPAEMPEQIAVPIGQPQQISENDITNEAKSDEIPAARRTMAEERRNDVLPRRTLRHLMSGEFGGYGGNYRKFLRPCFYSPIQCL